MTLWGMPQIQVILLHRPCQPEAFNTMKRAGIKKPRNISIHVTFRKDRAVSLVGQARIETIPAKGFSCLISLASAGTRQNPPHISKIGFEIRILPRGIGERRRLQGRGKKQSWPPNQSLDLVDHALCSLGGLRLLLAGDLQRAPVSTMRG